MLLDPQLSKNKNFQAQQMDETPPWFFPGFFRPHPHPQVDSEKAFQSSTIQPFSVLTHLATPKKMLKFCPIQTQKFQCWPSVDGGWRPYQARYLRPSKRSQRTKIKEWLVFLIISYNHISENQIFLDFYIIYNQLFITIYTIWFPPDVHPDFPDPAVPGRCPLRHFSIKTLERSLPQSAAAIGSTSSRTLGWWKKP